MPSKSLPLLLFTLCLVPVAWPAVAHAQSTRNLSTYWRDVALAQTTSELNAIRSPSLENTGTDSTVVSSMRRIREYELTLDKTNAFVVIRDLEKMIEKNPNDAWAHFALGTMLARGPDIRAHDYAEESAYQPQAYSIAATRAPRELLRALELDPTMDAAAIELGNFALDINKPEHIREAIDKLTANGRDKNPRALLLAAKLENKLLSPKRAANMAYEARLAGADASVAAYLRAMSLFRVDELKGFNDSIAASIYYSGIDSLSTEGADLYYSTLSVLVSPKEKAKWDAADLGGRKEWLRHFWDMHAGLAGVSPARRVTEHFARIEHADLQEHPPMFGPDKPKKQKRGILGWIFGGKPSVAEIHDEYIETLRHGDPNLTKKYVICPAGWDTLPVPLQPKMEQCAETTYGKLMYERVLRDNNLYEKGRMKAIAGESYYPRYNYHIQTAWEFMQFRAKGGGAEIVAASALDGSAADKLLSFAGELQPIVTVTLVDTVGDWVRRAYSSDRVSSHAFTADWITLFNATVVAPAAKNVLLRVAVENATYTAGRIDYGTVDIESFDPSQLTMSDIVMSPPGDLGGFKRGAISMTLAPGRTYTVDEVPTLYYEVYGSREDAALTTEITVEPVRESLLDALRTKLGRSDGAVSVHFSEKAGKSLPQFGLQQKRDIGLSSLLPGDYRIRVTVTEPATGRSTSRVRSLTIRELKNHE